MAQEPLPALCGYSVFSSAVQDAKCIDLAAYTLSHGATEALLFAAAGRGAHVHVQLDGAPFSDSTGGLARRNAAEVAALRHAGIDAVLDASGLQHAKTAIIDGVAYLDDKNWTGDTDLIVRDMRAADVDAVAADELRRDGGAADPPQGAAPAPNGIAVEKWRALRDEAAVAGDGAATIDLSTESVGPSTVTKILREAAGTAHVRLVVAKSAAGKSERSRRELAALAVAGVEIRTSAANQKLAVAGDRAWAGSANASGGGMSMRDWGLTFSDPAAVAALRACFDAVWASASPGAG